MKIEKKDINGINVNIYKTKRFSTIHLKFLFELDYTRDNLFKLDILENYLIHTTEKYPDRKSLGIRRRELYSMNFGMHSFMRGEKLFTEADFCLYDPELVKDDYIKDALAFISDMLFKPNFTNGLLDKDELERCKVEQTSNIGDELCNPKYKSYKSYINMMFPNSFVTRDFVDTLDEYKNTIDSYTDKDYIDMYQTLINSSLVGITLMGNIKDVYLEYIRELFKFKKVNSIDYDFKEKLKISTETDKEVCEIDPDVSDSTLRVVYQCKEAKSLKDEVIYKVIVKMMNGTGLIISKVLRDELKIVYGASANYNNLQNYICFTAYLDKDNKDLGIKGFEEVLKRLDDDKLLDELIIKGRKEIDNNLYVFSENKNNLLDELFDESFKLDPPVRKQFEIAKTVTKEEIKDALKDMKLIKIHFYKGVKKC